MIKTIHLPIAGRQQAAGGIVEVYCSLEGEEFPFGAGQYVKVGLPTLLYPDPKGPSRSFNIMSSPNDTEYLTFAFVMRDSGFKRTIAEVPLGTKVEVKGPFGVFTLPDSNDRPVVLMADGVGVTPCISMILYATEERLGHRLTLLYSNDGQEPAYVNELKKLEKENPNFVLKARSGGPIDAGFIHKNIKNVKEAVWLVAGKSNAIVHARKVIMGLGVAEQDVHVEEFTGY